MTSINVLIVILIFCTIDIHGFTESTGSSYYTAGVVEFRPNIPMMGLNRPDMLADILNEHLRAYDDIIRGEDANMTDIIVFPEETLNNNLYPTYVPSQEDNIIPCLKNSEFADFLIKLSCTARDVRKYLVINLTEKENCTTTLNDPRPCAKSGLNIYNTNVVFDREGRIISRYRKVHVYVEDRNKTYEPEYGIFETDFGVRFGHFICFDILFYTPAQELVQRYNIKNFITTSYYFSELPFMTASQIQQSWAWGNNVNLLAAGASYPETGTTGTGIYAGNFGHLVSAMTIGTGVRKLFVARVPVSPSTHIGNISPKHQLRSKDAQTGIKLMKDPQISIYTSELLNFSRDSNITRFLCYGSFCCHFHIKTTFINNSTDSEHYKYRIGVFDGNRTYEKKEWSDIKVCALYACTSNDVHSCAEILKENSNVEFNVIFESIEISGEFEKVEKMLVMPRSLNDILYSLNSEDVAWSITDKSSHFDAGIRLIKPYKNLLSFGIYAQYFEKSKARKKSEYLSWSVLISIIVGMFARFGVI